MPPVKPKNIYNNPWYCLLTYRNFEVCESKNPVELLDLFSNISLDGEETKAKLHKEIEELWVEDFMDESEEPESYFGRDIFIYYIRFPDSDTMIKFEDAISDLVHNCSCNQEEYYIITKNLLIKELMVFKVPNKSVLND